VVAALLARELDGDCYLWFVAAVPEVRRRGLASELVRVALLDARERGCTTTTLESTKMAEPVYEQLGYHAFGRYGMWERRALG
jgi:ribosomal protein S18 acetylase RimI-like enzyme